MKKTLLSAPFLGLAALVLTPTAQAAFQSPPPAPAASSAPASDAEAKKRAEQARLLEAFKSLEQELMAALEVYQGELNRHNAQGLPAEDEPKVPTPQFFPNFEELAFQGQPDALRWCLGTVNMLSLTIEETNGKKHAYYERLVNGYPNSPHMSDIVKFLLEEGQPTGLGIERTVPLLDVIIERCTLPGVAPQALYNKSRLYGRSSDPAYAVPYKKTLEELIAKFPQTDQGKRAKGFLFQVDNLVVGKTAPDFTTEDVDGVKFKLSDYRGKVVVIEFWDRMNPTCLRGIPFQTAMVNRLANEPFAMIGVSTDTDKETFKKFTQKAGMTWRNSWQGGKSGPLIFDWGVGAYPTTYVLDANGVIRYREVREQALVQAVDALLDEMKAGPPAKDGKSGG